MLKGKRLYRDKSGTLWHLRSDGSGITYPTFVAENKFPSMLDGYEEIVPNDFYNKSSGVDLKDQLYLCEYTENHSVSLLAVEDTCINTDRNFLAYNIMNGGWLSDIHDCELFPMPDLIPGCGNFTVEAPSCHVFAWFCKVMQKAKKQILYLMC